MASFFIFFVWLYLLNSVLFKSTKDKGDYDDIQNRNVMQTL